MKNLKRKKQVKISKIAVIDAETDPFKRGRIPSPFLWGFYDGSEYLEFDKTEELIAHIQEFEGLVYAHNGGKFDFHFLLKHITRDEPISLINGRIVECKLGKAILRDSYALLPAPLSAYKKDEISYKIFEKRERNKPENKRKISQYLKGDCVYLYDMISQFIESYGLHLTQAGAAMKTFLEMRDIKAPSSTPEFFEKFSKFYFGGRVECFEKGEINGPLALYDINSAYPWAMLTEHPFNVSYVTLEQPSLDRVKETSFIEVICNSNKGLPYRDNKGLITFPQTSEPLHFYVIGHEFNKAFSLGLITDINIIRIHNFPLQENFGDYIQHFYKLRLDAKEKQKTDKERLDYWKAQDLFAKLLMNSLYGKFGSNPENYGHYIFAPDEYNIQDYESEGFEEYGKIYETPILRADLDDKEMNYYNVACAASITSKVRALLLETIHNSKGVKYCDTDSLLCETFGGETGAALGQWKHELNVKKAWIAGKKMYSLLSDKNRYKTASKGVKLEPKDIKKICKGESVFYTSQAPTFSVKKDPTFTKRNVKMT